MPSKTKKSFLAGMPAWGLAVMASFAGIILLLLLGGLAESMNLLGGAGEIFAHVLFGLMLGTACFFICRRHPKSVWYVPLICNAFFIIAAFVEPQFWVTSMWIFYAGIFLLSVIGAVLGAAAGVRRYKTAAE